MQNMSKHNINAWKSDQREILRAAFGPAFTRYTEMVNKVDEPDDYRKYLEFIAKQVGLEEPTLKSGPHDGLTTVQINIGAFHQAARRLDAVPFQPAAVIEAEDVEEVGVQEMVTARPQVVYSDPIQPPPAYAMPPGLAQQLAQDVVETEPDTMEVLDNLLAAS